MARITLTAPLAMEHGDPIIVANAAIWTMAGVAAVFLGLRFACRLTLTRTWWDDWLLLAGLLAMVVGSGLFTELLRLGFARTVLTGEPVSLLLLILDTTQRCALAFTKTSFSLTLLRVFPPGWQRILVLSLLFVLNAYVIVNTIFSWVDICEGHSANRITSTCITVKNQARLNTIILSAACDFVLAFLPWLVIRKLQMQPMEKLGAAIAMSLGALAGVAGIMKGVQTFRIMNPLRPDFFYQVWVLQVWNMAEPCVTIVAASIPVLRVFVRGTTRRRGSPTNLPAAASGTYCPSDGAGKFTASHTGASSSSSAATHTLSAADDGDIDDKSVYDRRDDSSAPATPHGITLTRRFTVEFDFAEAARRDDDDSDTHELRPAHRSAGY